MNILPQKSVENSQKVPEFTTPGDIRGMARHLFEVDSSVNDAGVQMGRYPAKTAIESMQNEADNVIDLFRSRKDAANPLESNRFEQLLDQKDAA